MKNLLNYITLSCIFIAGEAFAEDTKSAVNTQKYYTEIYTYAYDEPGVMDKISSVPFIGVGVQDFGQAGRSGVIYEARAAYGKTDYSSVSTGTTEGTPTYVFSGEVSWLKSYNKYNVFAGLGYRYLFDDWGGQTSSTGAWAYDRKSQYIYLPIGMMNYLENSGYFKAQYNHLLSGNQTSYTGIGGGTHHDQNHHQDSGYGYALEYAPNGKYSMFLRYWDIGDSEVKAYRGGTSLEPFNDTTEFGVKILF